MKVVLLSPGHSYAVSTSAGCTVQQDGVSITITSPTGVFMATSPQCTVSDSNATIQFVF